MKMKNRKSIIKAVLAFVILGIGHISITHEHRQSRIPTGRTRNSNAGVCIQMLCDKRDQDKRCDLTHQIT